jgi:hypothetical protein
MRASKLFVAAILVTLPLLGSAQEKEAKPILTPYGFILANAFFDSGTFTTKDYPGQVRTVDVGDAFLMSARQSRFGFRLAIDDTNWTGAAISGVIEFDFKGGQISGTNVNSAAPSTAWYNGLMRLRLANAVATWKFGNQSLALLAGQDYGIVNTLFAESLAWVADPLFWQAGNIWRRGPQFRLTYGVKAGDVGLTVAGAILSPADATTGGVYSVDYGAGNASGQPDIEGRVAATAKFGDIGATVGVGYHTGKRKYLSAAGATEDNLTAWVFGADADLNLTKFFQLKGEFYTGTGIDDTYNGVGPAVVGAAGARDTVDETGYWVQAIGKPIPELWITVGYGDGKGDKAVIVAAADRRENSQLEIGAIVNAGKFWRFGVEWIKTTTTYGDAAKFDASQLAFSSQVRF